MAHRKDAKCAETFLLKRLLCGLCASAVKSFSNPAGQRVSHALVAIRKYGSLSLEGEGVLGWALTMSS
jgi:hypothetical protein